MITVLVIPVSVFNPMAISLEDNPSILELRLQKLTALGINEIEEEIKKLSELITKYKKIINSKSELLKVISNELSQIKEKFSSRYLIPKIFSFLAIFFSFDNS